MTTWKYMRGKVDKLTKDDVGILYYLTFRYLCVEM